MINPSSATLDCEDIGIGKSEFVTKNQFLKDLLSSLDSLKNWSSAFLVQIKHLGIIRIKLEKQQFLPHYWSD